MSEQQSSGASRPPNSGGGNNNNRRHHHNNQRRRPQGSGGNQQPTPNSNANPGQNRNERPQGSAQAQQAQGQRPPGSGQRRRRPHHNRGRNPNQQGQSQNNTSTHQGLNIERIYEKYLNLLDQHLIARRKYHDLFYRADPAQKNKLERNFYNTLNDIRDFESKLAPEARELFEKRNNGLNPDRIYTTNHAIAVEGENPPPESEWNDPHLLKSQQVANYQEDTEESVGTADDYLKYKNLI